MRKTAWVRSRTRFRGVWVRAWAVFVLGIAVPGMPATSAGLQSAPGDLAADADGDGVADDVDPDPANPTVPNRALLVPGDLALAAGDRGLLRLDPVTGERGFLAWAPTFSPDDVVVAPSGRVYAADWGMQRIYTVDGATGDISLLTEGLSGFLGLDSLERPLVSTYGLLFRVDPESGVVTRLVAADPTGHTRTSPFGDVFAADRQEQGAVYWIDAMFGFSIRLREAPDYGSPRLVLTFPPPEGEILDLDAVDSEGFVALLDDGLQRFVASTGEWSTIPDRRAATYLWDPAAIALDPAGTIYLSGKYLDAPGSGRAVVALDPASGAERLLHVDLEAALRDPDGHWGLAVVPGPRLPVPPAECPVALSDQLAKRSRSRAREALRCLERPGQARSRNACLGKPKKASKRAARALRRAAERICGSIGGGEEASARVEAAAEGVVRGSLARLLGSFPDDTVVSRSVDSRAGRCQLSVAKGVVRCAGELQRSFDRCRRRLVGPHALLPEADFTACIAAAAEASACALEVLAHRARSGSCTKADLPALFPGCRQADAAGVASCAGGGAACTVCRAEADLDGLGGVCPGCP